MNIVCDFTVYKTICVSIFQLCMPSGLGFNTQKESKRPRFHSFLITKEDGSRVFGSAFTFFEEVRDKKICAAMQTLQHMYRAQPEDDLEEENQSSLQLRHSPKVTKRSSPRQSIKVFDSQTDTLFVTKCLCLITQYPFVTAQREYLRQLYEAIEKPLKSHLPLECYVYNILLEVPLPPPGRSLKFYGVSRPVFTQRPSKLWFLIEIKIQKLKFDTRFLWKRQYVSGCMICQPEF